MSVQALVQAAMVAALEGIEMAVFDAPPVRAALPYAVVEEAVLADWSTKDMAGREGRLAVLIHDGGERPVRLRALCGEAEAAIDAMTRDLGEGWRVVTLVFARSRIVRDGARWMAMSEWRIRMLKES